MGIIMRPCALGMGVLMHGSWLSEENKVLGPLMKPLGIKNHKKFHKPHNMSSIGCHYPWSEICVPL